MRSHFRHLPKKSLLAPPGPRGVVAELGLGIRAVFRMEFFHLENQELQALKSF